MKILNFLILLTISNISDVYFYIKLFKKFPFYTFKKKVGFLLLFFNVFKEITKLH